MRRSTLLPVLFLVLIPLSACAAQDPVEPEPEVSAASTPSPEPEQVEGNYMVPLSQLPGLSDAELSRLTEIPVASVTSGGAIDWQAVAERINENLLLVRMSGTTVEESEDYYRNSISVDDAAARYEQALYAGFVQPEATGLEGNGNIHRNNLRVAQRLYLLDEDGPLVTGSEITGFQLEGVPADDAASFTVQLHLTDNYFSSGGFDSASPPDFLDGRNADRDEVVPLTVLVEVVDGFVQLVRMQ